MKLKMSAFGVCRGFLGSMLVALTTSPSGFHAVAAVRIFKDCRDPERQRAESRRNSCGSSTTAASSDETNIKRIIREYCDAKEKAQARDLSQAKSHDPLSRLRQDLQDSLDPDEVGPGGSSTLSNRLSTRPPNSTSTPAGSISSRNAFGVRTRDSSSSVSAANTTSNSAEWTPSASASPPSAAEGEPAAPRLAVSTNGRDPKGNYYDARVTDPRMWRIGQRPEPNAFLRKNLAGARRGHTAHPCRRRSRHNRPDQGGPHLVVSLPGDPVSGISSE
ncbi:unnamed protein product, partial [Amoebophrya sp. A25]|eukprot:GSA25T00000940001.1